MKEQELFQSFAMRRKNQTDSKRKQTNNAIIYTRVSTKEQAENNASLETQMKYCMGYAQSNGLNVVQYFGGTYESAKEDLERKEFSSMLSFVKKNKEISYIIVYSLDRFSRTGSGAMSIKDDLRKQGINIIAVSQSIDTSTPSGELQENILLLFSKLDNDLRRNKSITGMQEKLREGQWIFNVPIGYAKEYGAHGKIKEIVINEKGKLIRKAFQWKANERLSNLEILDRLSAMGYTTNDSTLSNMFKNPFYCGIIASSLIPGEYYKGKNFPPIVSRELYQKVNGILSERFEKGKHKKEIEQLPLKLFVCCDSCEQPYTGYENKKKAIHYYKCRTKGCKNNINAKKLNERFQMLLEMFEISDDHKIPMIDMMEGMLDKIFADKKEECKLLKTQLSEIIKKQEKLEERFAFGEIDGVIFQKFGEKVNQEKQQIEKQLAETEIKSSNRKSAISSVLDLAVNFPKMWRLATLTQKHTLQNLLFPKGMRYDRENNRFRTFRINGLFQLIINKTKGLSENKKWIKSDFPDLIHDGGLYWIRTSDFYPVKVTL